MRVEDFIIDGFRNGGNGQQNGNGNNQVLGANLANLGANCCPTDNSQVLGVGDIAGLGRDCCPVNGDVLGIGDRGTRTIEVPEVLGVGEGETLVEVCIPVIPPGFSILFNLIEKRLVFDALVATDNKVFINGRLIKKIPFEVCDRSVTPVTGNISRLTLSNIRSITVEVPFALCIKVPGAVRGAEVVVLDYKVDSVELPNLRCPNLPCIRGIVEKDCIAVKVKVVEDVIITVPTT